MQTLHSSYEALQLARGGRQKVETPAEQVWIPKLWS